MGSREMSGLRRESSGFLRRTSYASLLNWVFYPTDVSTMRSTVGGPRRVAPESTSIRATGIEGAEMWVARLRLAAIALAAIIELVSDTTAPTYVLAGAMSIYGVVRLYRRTGGQVGAGLDVAVATVLLAATGGLGSSYVLVGLVACIQAGLVFPLRFAVAAGALLSTGSFPQVIAAVEEGSAEVRELIAWLMLFPLAAIAASFWGRIARGDSEGGRLLAEANSILSTLNRIAREMPGNLEVGGAAASALTSAREAFHSDRGVVLLREAGIFAPVAYQGVALPEVLISEDDEALSRLLGHEVIVAKREDLPVQFDGSLDDAECWLCAPLRRGEDRFGLILVACPVDAKHEANLLILRQIANDAGVAVENARLFREVRELSIDEERRRLARELHDAIGQSLTHIRLELEFLARHGVKSVEAAGEEAARLARVVDRAASEVRMMINGLSSMVSREGLAASLGTYLRDLRGLVLRDISFQSEGSLALPAGVEGEVFRIAQEAVGNALRHSKAQKIHVTMNAGDGQLVLTVEDDGIGFESPKRKKGLGIESMRERAEAIGGDLTIEPRPEGGTRVSLTFTLTSAAAAPPMAEVMSA